MAKNIEIRRKVSDIFDHADSLMYPKTTLSMVEGLTDSNGKLLNSVIPSYLLETKKLAGTITADTTFASLYGNIETFADSETSVYPGSYFISNGSNTIATSEDHYVVYGDDNEPVSQNVTLENGDSLFYIENGDIYNWLEPPSTTTITINAGDGIADLAAPYDTDLAAENIFQSDTELGLDKPTAAETGDFALMTGYFWDTTGQDTFNDAGNKYVETITYDGDVDSTKASELVIPHYGVADSAAGDVCLKITNDSNSSITYWIIKKGMETPPQNPDLYEALSLTGKHIWGVINNSYPLATTESAGIMSAADKMKLVSLYNYEHHTQSTINVDTSNVDVIDTLVVDSEGHTTDITTRTLPSASETASGVVELADTTDSTETLSTSKVLTPAKGKELVDYFSGLELYASVGAANLASHPDGAIALVDITSAD